MWCNKDFNKYINFQEICIGLQNNQSVWLKCTGPSAYLPWAYIATGNWKTRKRGNGNWKTLVVSDPARRCQRVWTTRVQSQGIYRVLERFVWAFICEHVHQGVEQGKGTHWRQVCHGSCSRTPGNGSAMMVMSSSGQQPHYVQESKAGGYRCDDHCLCYKSSKICSQ